MKSHKKMTKLVRFTTVSLVSALLMTASPAHSSSTDASFSNLPQEDALAADAAAYASAFGVSQAEAEWRLTTQAEYGEIVAAIEAAAPNRFGGSWIDHEGDFGLYIRLTGSSMPTAAEAILEGRASQ